MDFENIKELIKLVDSSDLAFFELQSGNDHVKMDKSLSRGLVENNSGNSVERIEKVQKAENTINVVDTVTTKEKLKNVQEKVTEVAEEDDSDSTITSPMVGTFYSKASPESEPFVKAGDEIAKGKVICIIEAMKLMNEIESEYSGKITKCLVKDGDMVEYGQPLFKIKGE